MRKNRILAVPYIFWLFLFTVVPLFMVVYFAFTTSTGQLTVENFSGMSQYAGVFFRSFRLAVFRRWSASSSVSSRLYYVPAKAEAPDDRHDSDHASDVDEFSGPYIRMADDTGEQRIAESIPQFASSASDTYYKYACGGRTGNDI